VVKTEEITFRNTFCPDKGLCFLAGKSRPTLLRGWLRDTGYLICDDLPLICHYLPLICHCLSLFATVRDYSYYSLFAIRDCSLFAIRYSGFPDTPLKQWFSHLFTLYFMRVLSVRAYAYSFLYGVAKSTYWRRAKPETFSLAEQIWHFSELFSLIYYFSAVSRIVWVFCSFLLIDCFTYYNTEGREW